jgi:hypothetical protein
MSGGMGDVDRLLGALRLFQFKRDFASPPHLHHLFSPPPPPIPSCNMIMPIKFTQDDMSRPSLTVVWVLAALAGMLSIPSGGCVTLI